MRLIALVITFVAVLGWPRAQAADWPRFRGADGNAASAEGDLPEKWSETEGVVWKTPLPGAGSSSPIVWGDRIFLTCYRGYGVSQREPGEMKKLERLVVALDRQTGKIVWEKAVSAKQPEDEFQGYIADHGYATSTPATDGERVYVFFGKSGVLAFDMEGNPLWQADVGNGSAQMGWGSGASLLLTGDNVIVNAAAEDKALVALDKKTGKQKWKTPADNFAGCWGTPLLIDLPGGKQEIVLSVPYEIWGFHPETGALNWYCDGITERGICTSVVTKDGVVYAVGGRTGGAVAVRAGGKDDVNKTHLLWRSQVGVYVSSPVIVGDHLYFANDFAHCLSLKNGETVYKERLPRSGQVYASLTAGDGKLYCTTRTSGTLVLATGPKYKMLASNKLSDDKDFFNASPVIHNGQLLLRSNKFLYCIRK